MEPFKLSMILIAFMVIAAHPDRMARVRVWLAMMAGSLIAGLYPNLWLYLAIDIVTAAVIMLPPKSVWQRAIGACYASMILLTVGYMTRDIAGLYIFLSPANSPDMLKNAHDFLGGASVVLLFVWGSDGLIADYRSWAGNRRALLAAKLGRVR